MLKGFLGKFSGEQRSKLSETYGCHWERDEDCVRCRRCATGFTVSIRRHHCRGCGGIYCENCCSGIGVIHGETVHVCLDCANGHAPGDPLKALALSMGEGIGESPCEQAVPISLHPGALYGSDSASPASAPSSSSSSPSSSGKASREAPTSGYFELANKSDAFICAKVLIGGNYINEFSRPSYISIPPQAIVSAEFDSEAPEISLYVLIDNPNEISAGFSAKQSVPPFAAVDQFRHVLVYRIQSHNKNVLLKMKPGGSLELRKGTSLKRMGIMGVFTGTVPAGEIHFDTNATAFEGVFNSMMV